MEEFNIFLSNIKGNKEEIGFLIELLRVLKHINDAHKIVQLLAPKDDIDELEEIRHIAMYDSVQTYFFNVMGSHLREAIKLFGKFKELSIYDNFKQSLDNKYKYDELEKTADEFLTKQGFVYDYLLKIRNVTFHYDVEKAYDWFEENSKERKPPYLYFNLKTELFALADVYDSYLFATNLFFNNDGKGLTFNLEMFMKLQLTFKSLSKDFFVFYKDNYFENMDKVIKGNQ